MADQTPYQALRAAKAAKPVEPEKPKRVYRRDPEVAKARAAERNRRNVEARRRAYLVLAQRYQAEFDEIYEAETRGLAAERGPLPGDEENH